MEPEPLVLIVTLRGTPHALPRARHVGRRRPVSITGKAKVYAGALERAARAAVLNVGGCDAVQQAFAGHALAVSILWRFPTKFRGMLGKPHTTRPDKDNLEKLALDCLQRAGALGGDDCRVALGSTAKLWGSAGAVAIRVEAVSDDVVLAQPAGKGRVGRLAAPPPWLEG